MPRYGDRFPHGGLKVPFPLHAPGIHPPHPRLPAAGNRAPAAQLTDHQPLQRMETLAPRALYHDDELGITRRLPLVSGVLFGSTMGVFAFSESLSRRGSVAGAFVYGLVVGVFGGVGYGLLFPWLLTWTARRMSDRVYAGDPRLVPPPPPGRYLYRLPCGYLRRPSLCVGGVLYLGQGGLRFDPHLRTPARFRESVVMEPLQDVELDLVGTQVPRWMWLWTGGRRTLQRIRVRWGGGEAVFGIPDAASVFQTLRQRIAVLKQDPPSSN